MLMALVLVLAQVDAGSMEIKPAIESLTLCLKSCRPAQSSQADQAQFLMRCLKACERAEKERKAAVEFSTDRGSFFTARDRASNLGGNRLNDFPPRRDGL